MATTENLLPAALNYVHQNHFASYPDPVDLNKVNLPLNETISREEWITLWQTYLPKYKDPDLLTLLAETPVYQFKAADIGGLILPLFVPNTEKYGQFTDNLFSQSNPRVKARWIAITAVYLGLPNDLITDTAKRTMFNHLAVIVAPFPKESEVKTAWKKLSDQALSSWWNRDLPHLNIVSSPTDVTAIVQNFEQDPQAVIRLLTDQDQAVNMAELFEIVHAVLQKIVVDGKPSQTPYQLIRVLQSLPAIMTRLPLTPENFHEIVTWLITSRTQLSTLDKSYFQAADWHLWFSTVIQTINHANSSWTPSLKLIGQWQSFEDTLSKSPNIQVAAWYQQDGKSYFHQFACLFGLTPPSRENPYSPQINPFLDHPVITLTLSAPETIPDESYDWLLNQLSLYLPHW